jgi:hypothetical protein
VAERWPAVIALIADHRRERADRRAPSARERAIMREEGGRGSWAWSGC